MSEALNAIGGAASSVFDAVSSVAAPIVKIAAPAVATFFGGPIAGALTSGVLAASSGRNPLFGAASTFLGNSLANSFFSNSTGGSGALNLAGDSVLQDVSGIPIPSDAGQIPDLSGTVLDPNTGLPELPDIPIPSDAGQIPDLSGTVLDPNSGITDSSGFDLMKFLLGKNAPTSLSGLFGDEGLIGAAGRVAPGLLALNYARNQPGFDPSQLQSVFNQAGANAPGFIQASIDPFQQNIAAGFGDLLQSQAKRGIRGSSFGDTDIANYLTITGRGLSDAGASAAQKAFGTQGLLAGDIARLTNQAQQNKNNLFGRAFDVLGRGLNPRGYAGLTLTPQ